MPTVDRVASETPMQLYGSEMYSNVERQHMSKRFNPVSPRHEGNLERSNCKRPLIGSMNLLKEVALIDGKGVKMPN